LAYTSVASLKESRCLRKLALGKPTIGTYCFDN
jgi:hypothetical protein